jgi:hypothetical protein
MNLGNCFEKWGLETYLVDAYEDSHMYLGESVFRSKVIGLRHGLNLDLLTNNLSKVKGQRSLVCYTD